MKTPPPPSSLTAADLLESPFWLAERFVVNIVNSLPDRYGDLMPSIKEVGKTIKSVYSQKVFQGSQILANEVSPNLHAGLIAYYRGMPKVLPTTALVTLKSKLVLFPSDVQIDWLRLVDYFLRVYAGIQETIGQLFPSGLVEDYIRLQFIWTSQKLGMAGLSYNDDVARQGLTHIMTGLQRDTKLMLEYYWERYRRPPLKNSILNIRSVIASLKFQAFNAEFVGMPIDVADRFNDLLNEDDYVQTMQRWVKLHELKESELSTALAHGDPVEEPPPSSVISLIFEDGKGTEIYNALKPHVDELQWDSLRSLLAGEEVAGPIIISGRPKNALVYVFLQALEAGHINNSKTAISNWIVKWFQVKVKGQVENMVYDYVYELLKDGNAPAKSSRIAYKP